MKGAFAININNSLINSCHFPAVTEIHLSAVKSMKPVPTGKWDQVGADDIGMYSKNVMEHLSSIKLTHALILCNNVTCNDRCHKAVINHMYAEVVSALKSSCEFLDHSTTKDTCY